MIQYGYKIRIKRKSCVFDRGHRKLYHKIALINIENRSNFEIESRSVRKNKLLRINISITFDTLKIIELIT